MKPMPGNEEHPSTTRVYLVLGFVCLVLMALLWSLDDFFVYTFLGLGAFLIFMSYWVRPRSAEKVFFREKESDKTYHHHQPGSPFSKVKSNPSTNAFSVLFLLVAGIFVVMFVAILISNENDNAINEPGYAYDMAEYFRGINEFDSAARYYRRAMHDAPTDVGPMMALGNMFLSQNQFDSARYYFDLATNMDPQYDDAFYNKALVKYYEGRYEACRNEALMIMERNPEYHDAKLLIGDCFYAENNHVQALQWYEQAYEAGVRTAELLHVMGYIYDSQNNIEKAVAFYQETLMLDTTKIEVYRRLGEMLAGEAGEYYRNYSARH